MTKYESYLLYKMFNLEYSDLYHCYKNPSIAKRVAYENCVHYSMVFGNPVRYGVATYNKQRFTFAAVILKEGKWYMFYDTGVKRKTIYLGEKLALTAREC